MNQVNIKFCLMLALPFACKLSYAQCTVNHLKNPSFELPVQSSLGNNYPVTLTDWTVTGGNANLIKVNGVADYYGGPNSASEGTQYLDIVNASGTVSQGFALSCPSAITFSGAFSSRETGNNWTAKIDIVDASNAVVATSSVYNFTTADADHNLSAGADAIWHSVSGTSTLLPAGTYSYRVSLNDFGNFDNAFLCIENNCVLPLNLSALNVTAGNSCQPKLEWKTTREANVKQFEIQASGDGSNFSTIATMSAANAMNGHSYSVNAVKMPGALSYYRLKVVDIDNSYKYSDIIRFNNTCSGNENVMAVYPNPVKEKLSVNVFSNKPVTIVIVSAKGQKLRQLTLMNGVTQVDVSMYPAGVYFITEVNKEKSNTIKFIRY